MPDDPAAGNAPTPAAPTPAPNVVPASLSLTDPGILVGLGASLLATALRKFGIIEDPTTLAIVITPFIPVIVGLFTHKTVTHLAAIRHGQARLSHVAGVVLLLILASMIPSAAMAEEAVADQVTSGASTPVNIGLIPISGSTEAPHWSVGTVAIGTYSLSLEKGEVAVGEQLGCVFAHVTFGGPNTFDISTNAILFGDASKAFALGADLCLSSTTYDLGICLGLKGNIRNGSGQTPGNGETWKSDFGFLFGVVGQFPSFHQAGPSLPTLRFGPNV